MVMFFFWMNYERVTNDEFLPNVWAIDSKLYPEQLELNYVNVQEKHSALDNIIRAFL